MKTCALHIPVCLDNISRITDERREYELECLKKHLTERKNDEYADLYISINGDCEQKYLDRINAMRTPDVQEIWHRENIGYQWGGYYDMFKKYPNYDWYATVEVDYYLVDDWFKRGPTEQCNHIGAPPFRDHIKLEFPPEITNQNKQHTKGSFHLCSKLLLQKIDKQFHCFTNAKGKDHNINGIFHGEIGFCTKIREVKHKMHAESGICFMR